MEAINPVPPEPDLSEHEVEATCDELHRLGLVKVSKVADAPWLVSLTDKGLEFVEEQKLAELRKHPAALAPASEPVKPEEEAVLMELSRLSAKRADAERDRREEINLQRVFSTLKPLDVINNRFLVTAKLMEAMNVERSVKAIRELFDRIQTKQASVAKLQYRSADWQALCRLAAEHGFRECYTGEDCGAYIVSARRHAAGVARDECMTRAIEIAFHDQRIPHAPNKSSDADADLDALIRWCVIAERATKPVTAAAPVTPPAPNVVAPVAAGDTYIVKNLHQQKGNGEFYMNSNNVDNRNAKIGGDVTTAAGDVTTAGRDVKKVVGDHSNAGEQKTTVAPRPPGESKPGWFTQQWLKVVLSVLTALLIAALLAWLKFKK